MDPITKDIVEAFRLDFSNKPRSRVGLTSVGDIMRELTYKNELERRAWLKANSNMVGPRIRDV